MYYGQFGNTGRNSFHGPGQNFTNLALMKDIYINESMRIELRLESFNTFNHVNFNAPNSNVSIQLVRPDHERQHDWAEDCAIGREVLFLTFNQVRKTKGRPVTGRPFYGYAMKPSSGLTQGIC